MEKTNLEREIESIARQKLQKIPNDNQIETQIDLLLKMKVRLDSNLKSKSKRESAILYKRFIDQSNINAIPIAKNSQRKPQDFTKKILYLEKQVAQADKQYRELLIDLRQYGPTGNPNPIIPNQSYSLPNQFQSTYQSTYNKSQQQQHYPSIGGTNTSQMNKFQNQPHLVCAGTSKKGSQYPNLDDDFLKQNFQQQNYGMQSQQQNAAGYPSIDQQDIKKDINRTPSTYSGFSDDVMQYAWQSSGDDMSVASEIYKDGLRKIYCPQEIIDKFIQIADQNTKRKLETCAILAGNEDNDNLIINTLIIPKQEGQQDHCFMTDEIQLYETQIQHQVMTIGWIHTHPQFSLFLSSVDLHNQLGYQLQLPEAVAIVYSPIQKERTKAFRIRDKRIESVSKCQTKGFHEHLDQYGKEEFEECDHLEYINGSQNGIRVEILDLR